MIADLPDCPRPGQVITIPAEDPGLAAGALGFVLEPFQPLREQFIAITGIGLEDDGTGTAAGLRSLRLTAGPDGAQVAVMAAGQAGAQRVIFIHGSPGLAEEWRPFLADVPPGRLHLAPDRPGYGDSGADPVTDLQAHADALHPLLGPATQPGVVLVGYSYGGPVALRIAADRPDRVAGVLLVGAAADPGLEEIHPLQEVAALDFFAQLLPSELASSNAELMSLRPGLEDLAPDLAGLRQPVTILQGLSDTLVPAANVDYLRAMLPEPPTVILIEGADHFLPWTHAPLLTRSLDCLVASLPDQAPRDLSAGK